MREGRFVRRAWLVALLMSAVWSTDRRAWSQETTPQASVILARTADTYAKARSYQDDGEVTTILAKGNDRQTVGRPFATGFIRPNWFRFEFTDSQELGGLDQRFVVWTNSGVEKANRWWSVRPSVSPGRLDHWLAGGRTLSGGTSLAIPQLLVPGLLKAPRVLDLKSPRSLPNQTLDGVACLVFAGQSDQPDEEVTLWIGETDFLIRQIRRASKAPPNAAQDHVVRSEDLIRFRPHLNVPIPEDRFRFTPPEK